MSTAYRDAVLVDAPLVYLRLDETGAAAHLMEIEDSSGNGRHGGLYYVDSSGTYEPLGHPSGIETDSDSSGFLSKSAAASDQGSVWVPGTSSAMKPAGDCAVEAWVRVGPNYSFATSDPYWVAGKGVLVGLRSTSGMYFAAGITVGGVTHWITATGIAPQAGAWYHLVATRVGTSFNLYVNGAFVDSAAVGAGSNDHTDDPFRCGHNTRGAVGGARPRALPGGEEHARALGRKSGPLDRRPLVGDGARRRRFPLPPEPRLRRARGPGVQDDGDPLARRARAAAGDL
jgi:hypothetical protein